MMDTTKIDFDSLFAGMQQWLPFFSIGPGASQVVETSPQDAGVDARRLLELAGQFYVQQFGVWGSTFGDASGRETVSGGKGDRRFDADQWKRYPLFDYIRQSYLLTSKSLLEAVDLAWRDERSKEQIRFVTRQFIDAMSPANFALTNPEVLSLAVETNCENFSTGLKNFLQDMEKGGISLTSDAAFDVGGNLANTPGGVVYVNDLIQLIQYHPVTEHVKTVPLLIIPSVVNKYYILDLSPEASLVRYLVSEGFTVFMISWRNITPALRQLTWEDYVDTGVLGALDVVRKISKCDQINTVGYCVGGALLSSALAVRAAQGKRPAASMTLLMTMLEFSDPGEIGVYLNPAFMAQREAIYAGGGIVSGKELTLALSSLRANDLIWSFVVDNYLKGKTPDAFDLFYWNTDESNLPGPMFAWYLRHCYIENKLVEPGALTMLDTSVDLRQIGLPTYVFAASEDHLVPWKTAYESVNHLEGTIEFVLGGGGHITGPINPPSKNKRHYWIGGLVGENAEDWRASAQLENGSWWPHWGEWLGTHSGNDVLAPSKLGSSRYKEIETAPGRYAKSRTSGTTQVWSVNSLKIGA